jgi:hypothetical protein
MARMSIIGNGFKELAEKVDRCNPAALKPAVDKALNATGKYVQTNVDQATLPYAHKGLKGYATGEMFQALKKDNPVIWSTPFVAEVSVGFNLGAKGGFHSIFVMYGTPRMSKDPKLYNSIKGTKTKKDVEKLQTDILNDEFHKAIKG